MSVFFSKQLPNQWTRNYAVALFLAPCSCVTFLVQLNVRFHLGLPGDLVLMKTVMTNKGEKVGNDSILVFCLTCHKFIWTIAMLYLENIVSLESSFTTSGPSITLIDELGRRGYGSDTLFRTEHSIVLFFVLWSVVNLCVNHYPLQRLLWWEFRDLFFSGCNDKS